jgi:AcrR family transcriptional regulator
MPRKSMAEERREEILAAFARCIAKYGIEVSLEQIAQEAGVRRSLIRHYLGNRDELVDQVIERIAEGYPQRIAELLAPTTEHGIDHLLDVFFRDGYIHSEWDEVIGAVFSTAQGRYPQAKARVAHMIVAIVEQTAAFLSQLYPRASIEACYEVAYGIICLSQSNESLIWLGIDPMHATLARAAAKHLLNRLAAP